MNLTSINSKSKFIVVGTVLLVIILAILAGISLNKVEPQKQPTLSTLPTPTIQSNFIVPPTTPPADKQQNIDQKKQIILADAISNNNGDIMLLQNQNFYIKYVTSADIFFVTLYQEPLQDFKNSATKWFLDQNLTQNDLCLLNVRFRLATNGLAKNNPDFSSLPTGC